MAQNRVKKEVSSLKQQRQKCASLQQRTPNIGLLTVLVHVTALSLVEICMKLHCLLYSMLVEQDYSVSKVNLAQGLDIHLASETDKAQCVTIWGLWKISTVPQYFENY